MVSRQALSGTRSSLVATIPMISFSHFEWSKPQWLKSKSPLRAGFLILLEANVVGSTQVFVDRLMQMADPAFLIACQDDLAGG